MKQIIIALLVALTATGAYAQKTSELRYNYVMKNLKLDKATATKAGPVIKSFIKEMKDAGDIYDDVKDKYKSDIKNGTLTNKQAASLNQAKVESATKEAAVKSTYYTKFKQVMSEKQTFLCFRLCADKKSKFVESKKSNSEEDED